MALGVPSERTWNVGDIPTAAQLNSNLRDGINFLTNPPVMEATNATVQSIPNAAFTTLTWDTWPLDTYSGHTSTSYVGQVAGYYQVDAFVSFAASAAGRRLLLCAGASGGSVVSANQVEGWCTSSAGGVTARWLVYIPYGGGISIQAYQSSGGALNSSSLLTSTFGVRWVHA